MLKKAHLGLEKVKKLIMGQQVVLRVDWNVPYKNDKVSDSTRVKSTIQSIKSLKELGAKNIVVLSHLGRPQGKPNPAYSFKPLVSQFEEILSQKINFIEDITKSSSLSEINSSQNKLFLAQNIRFYKQQERKGAPQQKIQQFNQNLTNLGTIYVNDAFGASHRAHSSIVGVSCPIRVGGYLMHKQISHLGKVMQDPARPLTFILGGSKVKDKIKLIDKVIDIADNIIIVGGMSYTFLKKNGISIGSSIFDEKGYSKIDKLLQKIKSQNKRLAIPLDSYVAVDKNSQTKQSIIFSQNGIPDGKMGLDIGQQSLKQFDNILKQSKTVVWNGPCGVVQNKNFRQGSKGIYDMIIKYSSEGMTSIVGGGDTVSFVNSVQSNDKEKISHISTGGGASIQLLQGNKMPGIDILNTVQQIK